MRILSAALVASLLALGAGPAGAAAGKKVTITGEIIDSWCYLTEIMYPLGTAHHQCALWCAVGGVPVGILDADGVVHVILEIGDEPGNVAPEGVLKIQTHKVTFEGTSIERDGMRYLLVSKLVEDQGIVNQTHEDRGIQPFGD